MTTTDRPTSIAGIALMFLVSAIVAIGLAVARLLERAPDSHCPACGRPITACTCWTPGGALSPRTDAGDRSRA